MGLKFRWFRAQMKMETSSISSELTSLAGVYRSQPFEVSCSSSTQDITQPTYKTSSKHIPSQEVNHIASRNNKASGTSLQHSPVFANIGQSTNHKGINFVGNNTSSKSSSKNPLVSVEKHNITSNNVENETKAINNMEKDKPKTTRGILQKRKAPAPLAPKGTAVTPNAEKQVPMQFLDQEDSETET